MSWSIVMCHGQEIDHIPVAKNQVTSGNCPENKLFPRNESLDKPISAVLDHGNSI